MKKLNIPWHFIFVYLATLSGVFVSGIIPTYNNGKEIELSVKLGRLLIGAIIAFYLVIKDENNLDFSLGLVSKPPKETAEQKAARILAMRKNTFRRISSAFGAGLSWNIMIQNAPAVLQQTGLM